MQAEDLVRAGPVLRDELAGLRGGGGEERGAAVEEGPERGGKRRGAVRDEFFACRFERRVEVL